jgi:predicted GIY-YIG superfamily endonuclease
MHIYTIYQITNTTNNKCYVGFDSKFPRRINEHKTSSFNPEHKDYNLPIHRAIRKYGWDNFIWAAIYQSVDRDHTLKTMEPHFIKEYDSYQTGYNATKGGDGTFGYKRPPEKCGNLDRTIYTFVHPDHGLFTGTRFEFVQTFGLQEHASWIARVIRGNVISCKGWCLENARGKQSGRHGNNKTDTSVYHFVHPKHGDFVGTRNQLTRAFKETPLRTDFLLSVIKGEYKHHKGWTVRTIS